MKEITPSRSAPEAAQSSTPARTAAKPPAPAPPKAKPAAGEFDRFLNYAPPKKEPAAEPPNRPKDKEAELLDKLLEDAAP